MVWVIRNVYTGRTHTIMCEGLTVGRQYGLSLVCKNVLVSRTHAKLFLLDNTPYVLDDSSTNGTYINGRNISYKGQVKLEKDDELGFAMFRTKGNSVPNFPYFDIKKPHYIYKVLNLPDFIDLCDSDSEDSVVFVEHKADESNNFETSSKNINNNELLQLTSEEDLLKTKPKNCTINTVENNIEATQEAADNNILIRCDNDSLSKNCDNNVKQISCEEKELSDVLDALDDDEGKKESKETKKKRKRSTSFSSNHSSSSH